EGHRMVRTPAPREAHPRRGGQGPKRCYRRISHISPKRWSDAHPGEFSGGDDQSHPGRQGQPFVGRPGAGVTQQPAGWYLRSLMGMSPSEVTWRRADKARQQTWRRRQVTSLAGLGFPSPPHVASLTGSPRFEAILPFEPFTRIPDGAARPVIAAADEVL